MKQCHTQLHGQETSHCRVPGAVVCDRPAKPSGKRRCIVMIRRYSPQSGGRFHGQHFSKTKLAANHRLGRNTTGKIENPLAWSEAIRVLAAAETSRQLATLLQGVRRVAVAGFCDSRAIIVTNCGLSAAIAAIARGLGGLKVAETPLVFETAVSGQFEPSSTPTEAMPLWE